MVICVSRFICKCEKQYYAHSRTWTYIHVYMYIYVVHIAQPLPPPVEMVHQRLFSFNTIYYTARTDIYNSPCRRCARASAFAPRCFHGHSIHLNGATCKWVGLSRVMAIGNNNNNNSINKAIIGRNEKCVSVAVCTCWMNELLSFDAVFV